MTWIVLPKIKLLQINIRGMSWVKWKYPTIPFAVALKSKKMSESCNLLIVWKFGRKAVPSVRRLALSKQDLVERMDGSGFPPGTDVGPSQLPLHPGHLHNGPVGPGPCIKHYMSVVI